MRAYERLGIVSLHEVMDAIKHGRPFEYDGIVCHTGGNRLLTYRVHGLSCCVNGCSACGEYFAVERAINQKGAKYHLNLYHSKNGHEVMMTSDHKIPKSLGGKDHISNRQPMCQPHNFEKGNRLIYT